MDNQCRTVHGFIQFFDRQPFIHFFPWPTDIRQFVDSFISFDGQLRYSWLPPTFYQPLSYLNTQHTCKPGLVYMLLCYYMIWEYNMYIKYNALYYNVVWWPTDVRQFVDSFVSSDGRSRYPWVPSAVHQPLNDQDTQHTSCKPGWPTCFYFMLLYIWYEHTCTLNTMLCIIPSFDNHL